MTSLHMPKRRAIACFRLMALATLSWLLAQACFAQATATGADRIVQAVDSSRMLALRGNVHPLARPEFDQGEVDGAMVLPRVTLFFKPTASQQADLETLLAEQQDRASPNYHRWLTPEQFGERFGMSAADLAKVTVWLQAQGFSAIETARGRNWVVFSATAQQVSAALRTRIHRYGVRGESHFANATEPLLPAAFADVVGGFRGLDDFRLRARAVSRAAPSVEPNFTSSISGRHFVAPGDFATIYDVNALYSSGIDGTGQKIAVVGQTDISLSDDEAFRAAAGLPAKDPQVVLVGADPGTSSADIDEANLDVEWAGAVAKNATIIYVNSTNVINSMQAAIEQNLAPVISISYGGCETTFGSSNVTFVRGLGQQANAQGITIVAAAGDGGATDCDTTAPATQGLAVDLPASLPSVTGVGGTQFNEGSGTYWQATVPNGPDIISSALSYIPEVVWNQTPSAGKIFATGGGASALFSKPAWQTGPGVPNDGARDVPDISFNAAPDLDGYLICSQGWCTNGFRNSITGNLDEIGGTSAGVPTFAGVVALINQQTGSSGQGNLNGTLYALAASSANAFHDIQNGNNAVPYVGGSTPDCALSTLFSIGYTATPGYDLATGIGSVDAGNLVASWTSVSAASGGGGLSPNFQLAFASQTLSVRHGTCGTAQLALTPINGFSGQVNFTCTPPSTLAGAACRVLPGSTANVYVLTLDVPATAAGVRGPLRLEGSRWWPEAAVSAVFILFAACSKRRRPLVPALLVVCLLAVGFGCGGSSAGNSGTSGNSLNVIVTVNGTVGSLSHTAQINVTVN